MERKIILQVITPEELVKELLFGIDDRIKDLVKKPEKSIEYLTRQDVARRLSITLPTLHDWTRRGLLESFRIGNRVYYRSDQLEKSLKSKQKFQDQNG